MLCGAHGQVLRHPTNSVVSEHHRKPELSKEAAANNAHKEGSGAIRFPETNEV